MEQPAPDPVIHIRVPPDLHAQLARLASAEERPVSTWIRRALRDLVQRTEGRAA
jgi:predicted transcriptional regulator